MEGHATVVQGILASVFEAIRCIECGLAHMGLTRWKTSCPSFRVFGDDVQQLGRDPQFLRTV